MKSKKSPKSVNRVCCLFPDHNAAVQAAETLSKGGLPPERLTIMDTPAQLLDDGRPPHSTSPVRGVAIGATIGATAGGLLGAVAAGPLGFPFGSALLGAAFGAGSGAVFGGLGGGLVGADVPDGVMQDMAEALAEGQSLLVVSMDSAQSTIPVRRTVRAEGGHYQATL